MLTIFTSLAVFTKALCQLMEVMCGPLLQTLENRLQVNLKRTAALETEKETLEKEVAKLTAELQESTWHTPPTVLCNTVMLFLTVMSARKAHWKTEQVAALELGKEQSPRMKQIPKRLHRKLNALSPSPAFKQVAVLILIHATKRLLKYRIYVTLNVNLDALYK